VIRNITAPFEIFTSLQLKLLAPTHFIDRDYPRFFTTFTPYAHNNSSNDSINQPQNINFTQFFLHQVHRVNYPMSTLNCGHTITFLDAEALVLQSDLCLSSPLHVSISEIKLNITSMLRSHFPEIFVHKEISMSLFGKNIVMVVVLIVLLCLQLAFWAIWCLLPPRKSKRPLYDCWVCVGALVR
jgi:hypothetical protein